MYVVKINNNGVESYLYKMQDKWEGSFQNAALFTSENSASIALYFALAQWQNEGINTSSLRFEYKKI